MVMGWESIVDLAWRRVGLLPEIFITPGIPPRKESTVRSLYQIPGDEPVLVLLDDTAWGSAKDGAVLTPSRLCWRDMMSQACQRPWEALKPEAVVETDAGEVSVEGEPISLDLVPCEHRSTLAAFLREVIAAEAPAPFHPFRGGGLELGYRDGPLERRALVEDRILGLAHAYLGEDSETYCSPNIPERKLKSVAQAHALCLPDEERILVVHDATVFGSAEEGFVLTGRRLCWKNLGEHPRQIPWPYLSAGDVQLTASNSVGLGGCHVDLLGETDQAASVCELLCDVRRLFD